MPDTKRCSKCGRLLDISCFSKDKQQKSGLACYCKACHSSYQKLRYKANREAYLSKRRVWRATHPEYSKNWRKHNAEYEKERNMAFPWLKTWDAITARCNQKSSLAYRYYGAKGIRRRITRDELKELWFRDKAYLMDQPSIDRKDADGDYTFSNCQYIELDENKAKARRVQRNLHEEIRSLKLRVKCLTEQLEKQNKRRTEWQKKKK